MGKGRRKAQKERDYGRERSEKGNLTRARPRTVPMRTCLLLPHAFKYKETRFVDGAHATSMEFVGYSWGKLHDARPPSPARGMHFVHTVPLVALAPFTLFLPLASFLAFFASDSPRDISLFISFFLFLQVSITDESQLARKRLFRYSRARTEKNADALASRASHEGKPHRDDSHRRKRQLIEIHEIKRIWKAEYLAYKKGELNYG